MEDRVVLRRGKSLTLYELHPLGFMGLTEDEVPPIFAVTDEKGVLLTSRSFQLAYDYIKEHDEGMWFD